MKNIITVFLLMIFIQTNAQHKIFIRIYNTNNQKITKGYLQKTTDSTLTLSSKGNEIREVSIKEIKKIRLKRSAGLTALIVGGIPITAGLVFFARNEGWDGLAGMVLFMEGLIAGPAAGGLKALINPKPLIINGDIEKWNSYKKILDQKLK